MCQSELGELRGDDELMASTQNVFSIGRRRREEDQLTEMLVWLVSAVPDAGRALLSLAIEGKTMGVDGDLEVTTQHGIAAGRLDVLVLARDLAIVVESKIESHYSDDQIERYLRWLGETHGRRTHCGLMTLTAHTAPWQDADRELAESLGIVRSERLWEELHAAFEPLTDDSNVDPLEARLIREFLQMIADEGLIPMKPLDEGEYERWAAASATVDRFHGFFDACKGAIGAALGATPSSNGWSKSAAYAYQDYVYDDGARIAVGMNCSDGERAPRSLSRSAPILWLAVEANDWPNWAGAKDKLDANLPEGWRPWQRWWGKRPQIWRYLDEVIGEGTFDEQRDRLAAAATTARDWLDGARIDEGSVPLDDTTPTTT